MITIYLLNEAEGTLRIKTVETCQFDDWENQIGGQEMSEEEVKIKSSGLCWSGLRKFGINARYELNTKVPVSVLNVQVKNTLSSLENSPNFSEEAV